MQFAILVCNSAESVIPLPDDNGVTIPLTAERGQIIWSVYGPDGLAMIGRSEQADTAKGVSNNYACQSCCPDSYVASTVEPVTASVEIGGTMAYVAKEQRSTCNGQPAGWYTVGAAWSSLDNSVATVSSGGVATGVAPGSANIKATWTAYSRFPSFGGCQSTSFQVGPVATINVTCTTPTNETTAFAGWADSDGFPTVGKWTQTLSPATPGFSGRTVTEQDPGSGGPDNCWFNGSIIPPQTAITGGSWTVTSSNTWGFDFVGLTSTTVNYYRAQGRAPCSVTVPQRMVIDCSTGALTYRTNTLGYVIGDTRIFSIRDGSQQSRTWP
ncbi:MAG TPA: Ig-like domain-containing protein [Pyrinomonadaceae bacterium]|nr:Ig-like domain-containing protein [Pyrinomonadaceae bacterium]